MLPQPPVARLLAALTAVALTALPSLALAQNGPVNGTLVVTNKAPSTATIIDVGSGRTLATLPTGQGPHEVAISADGSTAVVTDYATPGGGHTLTVIDVPGLRVARTIELGQYRMPHGIRFLPGDSLVAVTSERSGSVVVVHVASGEVRRAIPTTQGGSHMVAVVADGSRGYTGNISSATVSELDLRRGTFLRTFAVPPQPEAIGVTRDGREVWVGSNATGRVSVIEPASSEATVVAEGFAWPYRVLFTPDLSTVVIPDLTRDEVRFFDRASRRQIGRLAVAGGGPQGVTLTPDGRYLFLSLSKRARVGIIDIGSRTIIGQLDAGDTPDGVAYTRRVIAR